MLYIHMPVIAQLARISLYHKLIASGPCFGSFNIQPSNSQEDIRRSVVRFSLFKTENWRSVARNGIKDRTLYLPTRARLVLSEAKARTCTCR
jgi:hypothetical protein